VIFEGDKKKKTVKKERGNNKNRKRVDDVKKHEIFE